MNEDTHVKDTQNRTTNTVIDTCGKTFHKGLNYLVGRSEEHVMSGPLVTRGIGCVFLIAFLSYWVQVEGLIGDQGIAPATDFMSRIWKRFGIEGYTRLPSLFWIWPTTIFLHILCALGCITAILQVIRPTSIWCMCTWLIYLSLLYPGQLFYRFQWDLLLVESGFLCLFFFWGTKQGSNKGHIRGHRFPLLLTRLLLFRLLFSSGVGKLLHGGKTWNDGRALDFHFWTQPLPNPIAYYLNLLPDSLLETSVYCVFVLQCVVPFTFLGSRPLRLFGFYASVFLQLLIAGSGNFAFFNLLTVVLCFSLLDDRHLEKLFPFLAKNQSTHQPAKPNDSLWKNRIYGIKHFSLGFLLYLHLLQITDVIGAHKIRDTMTFESLNVLRPFHLVNGYGLFISMTTSRKEIIIEGSDDGRKWEPYLFRYKPNTLRDGLSIIAPHQPRLDWQMWFAALGDIRRNQWLNHFMKQIQNESSPVLNLLQTNPFPNKPPRYIRALSYQYTFTDLNERRQSGRIWKRHSPKIYAPPIERIP